MYKDPSEVEVPSGVWRWQRLAAPGDEEVPSLGKGETRGKLSQSRGRNLSLILHSSLGLCARRAGLCPGLGARGEFWHCRVLPRKFPFQTEPVLPLSCSGAKIVAPFLSSQQWGDRGREDVESGICLRGSCSPAVLSGKHFCVRITQAFMEKSFSRME